MVVNLHRARTPSPPPKIHDGDQKGGIKQEPFTEKVGRNTGTGNGLQKLVENVQKTKENGVKMFIEMMRRPSINEDKNDNSAALAASMQSSTAQAEASVITAKAAEIQQKAAQMMQTRMLGKSVKVVSTRSFSAKAGERVVFNYDIAKNIPKDASISGNVHILDANKKKVRSDTIRHMSTGKNEFFWDGLTDMGKMSEAGQYTLQVNAFYKTPGSDNSIPAIVNTMTEAKIIEIDMDNWEATLDNGSVVSMNDITKIFDKESMDKVTKAKAPPSITDDTKYLHKHIIIKEDKVTFEGGDHTKLGFQCPEDKNKVFVKAVATHNKEVKSIEIKEMDLTQGRNEFIWSGEAVTNLAELKRKEDGESFGKVGYSDYDYVIYVSDDKDGPWEAMSPKSQVFVDGTEQVDGQTMLALKGGGLVPASRYDGLAKVPEGGEPEELISKAASYAGKGVLARRMAVLDGVNPASRYVPLAFDPGTELSIRAVYYDQEGTEIRQIEITEAQVNEALANTLKYENMTDESKDIFHQWVSDTYDMFDVSNFDDGEAKYEYLLPDAKEAADAHLFSELKDKRYTLKKNLPHPAIELSWDGMNGEGRTMAKGYYPYDITMVARETKVGGETLIHDLPDRFPMHVQSTAVVNGSIIATIGDKFEQSREIEITPETVFVA